MTRKTKVSNINFIIEQMNDMNLNLEEKEFSNLKSLYNKILTEKHDMRLSNVIEKRMLYYYREIDLRPSTYEASFRHCIKEINKLFVKYFKEKTTENRISTAEILFGRMIFFVENYHCTI